MHGFETARLRMRPLDARDEGLHCALYCDAETMRFICPPLSREQALKDFRAFIKQPRPARGPHLFAIEPKGSGAAFGICAAVHIDAAQTRAEVGVMLQSGARGQGYAREALAGMVRSTFLQRTVRTVWVQCSALNPLVERMVSSIGFVLDDQDAAGEGPLSQRTWSVQRQSWCPTYPEGEGNVERREFS